MSHIVHDRIRSCLNEKGNREHILNTGLQQTEIGIADVYWKWDVLKLLESFGSEHV